MTEEADLGLADPTETIRKCPDCGFDLEDATADGGPAYLKGYRVFACKLGHWWAKRR